MAHVSMFSCQPGGETQVSKNESRTVIGLTALFWKLEVRRVVHFPSFLGSAFRLSCVVCVCVPMVVLFCSVLFVFEIDLN